MSALASYQESVAEARSWFAVRHPAVNQSFDILDSGFRDLVACIQQGRGKDGTSQVSLGLLLLIAQRQCFVALDLLSARQAYQAWLIVRPAIECALMMGKWVDDPANAQIWLDRSHAPQRYRSAYSGQALVSASLPGSRELQASLKELNDSFSHPNVLYLGRHLALGGRADEGVEVKFDFFDSDEFHWASVLGMLHLLVFTQTAIARMFEKLLVNVHIDPESFGLRRFREMHRDAALAAASAGASEHTVIHSIGLWPTSVAEA